MRRLLALLPALALTGATLAADTPQQAFVKAWEGRTVTVKTTLYSLMFNERGKLGTTRSGLREGLIVATPSQGAYFEFAGRQGRENVTRPDLQRFVAAVNHTYEPDALDVRTYRKLEAVAINPFEVGGELLVTRVRVDRDEVRFAFAKIEDTDAVTGITVRWPVPLSKSFSERGVVEDLVQRFVEIAQN
jgi:hypothetical protein